MANAAYTTNVIVYTTDFEPITMIELPVKLLEEAKQHKTLALKLKNPETPDEQLGIVRLVYLEMPWIDNTLKPILVTHDEVLALKLKPTWLVGQRVVIRAYERMLKLLTDKLKKAKPKD